MTHRSPQAGRIAWVDYARGWCIVMVVLMHSTLGVGRSMGDTGWLHAVVAFAKPFRMPDFFIVAGLFAVASVDGTQRRFLDHKVVHFVYFYVLWLFIELVIKAHGLGIATPEAFTQEYLSRLFEPFSSMWFIQLLPILYLATRFCRRLPRLPVLGVALILHYIAAAFPSGGIYVMESRLTSSTTANSFLLFWVYFLVAHSYRNHVFQFAHFAASKPIFAALALAAWIGFQGFATNLRWPELYGLDLAFGLLGAGAVVVMAALLAKFRLLSWLSVLGRNSLTIYLAFFLPMAAARTLVVWLTPGVDIGLLALAVTFAGVVGPLILQRALGIAGLRFLFERPYWARLSIAERAPAEADTGPIAYSRGAYTNPESACRGRPLTKREVADFHNLNPPPRGATN